MNELSWCETVAPASGPSPGPVASEARPVEALIVGGGPAGCAAALGLAAAGCRPELIERSSGPREMVCGGFLGWDALAALRRLGIDPDALGARPIERLRLVVGKTMGEARLPYAAAGLSRRRLDEALIDRAIAAGATVRRGCTARAFETGMVRLDDGTRLACQSLFLATGKHELRGLARPLQPGHRPPAVGLRARLAPDPARTDALTGMIELHLFDRGYAGLLLQEDGSTNFCLSVAPERLVEAGSPDALVARLADECPRLAERLGGEQPPLQAIARVPYGWRSGPTESGLFRLGDQAAVIASLVGDGIAIALASGAAAAAAWAKGGAASAANFQRSFSARAATPLFVAERLRRSAESRSGSRVMQALVTAMPGSARAAALLTRI